jgi:hypothetical protein
VAIWRAPVWPGYVEGWTGRRGFQDVCSLACEHDQSSSTPPLAGGVQMKPGRAPFTLTNQAESLTLWLRRNRDVHSPR